MYSIGALARDTGLKIPTIRFYEQIGLIAPPERTEGNQRRYDRAARDRLRFVRHSRDLGLPLDAIRDLLRLKSQTDQLCEGADKIAADHLARVRDRIARLKRLESELIRIVAACDGHHRADDCNVISALADHSQCDSDHEAVSDKS